MLNRALLLLLAKPAARWKVTAAIGLVHYSNVWNVFATLRYILAQRKLALKLFIFHFSVLSNSFGRTPFLLQALKEYMPAGVHTLVILRSKCSGIAFINSMQLELKQIKPRKFGEPFTWHPHYPFM